MRIGGQARDSLGVRWSASVGCVGGVRWAGGMGSSQVGCQG